jgi:hypothetical protein
VPTAEQIRLWDKEISEAEELRTNRPEAMDVMAPRIEKGQFIPLLPCPIYHTHFCLAPSLADKRLELLKQQERGVAGETAWMIAGLKLEEQQ